MEDLAAAASEDKLVHEQKSTKAFIQDKCLGDGTLCIRESLVSWSSGGPDDFQLQYPRIAVHAICRDVTQFPHECLYLLVSPDVEVYDDKDEEEDEPAPPSVVRFVPEDKTTLEAMFAALSQCQALHPDPEEDSDEDEQPQGDVRDTWDHFYTVELLLTEFGAGEYFTSGQDINQLSPEGQAILERLNNQMLQMPGPGEFEQLLEDNGEANGHVNGTTDNYEDAD